MEVHDFLAQLGRGGDDSEGASSASRPNSAPAAHRQPPTVESLIELDIAKATEVLQRQGVLRAWMGGGVRAAALFPASALPFSKPRPSGLCARGAANTHAACTPHPFAAAPTPYPLPMQAQTRRRPLGSRCCPRQSRPPPPQRSARRAPPTSRTRGARRSCRSSRRSAPSGAASRVSGSSSWCDAAAAAAAAAAVAAAGGGGRGRKRRARGRCARHLCRGELRHFPRL